MTAVLHRPLFRVAERKAKVARRSWWVFVAGGAEPFLFLFSVGVGVGALVADLIGPGGVVVTYQEFVAPGMLAGAVMNTAVFDTTIVFFIAFKYVKTYDAMLATPLTTNDLVRGELSWTLLRVGLYGTVFLIAMLAMGLVASPWAVLAIPVVILIGAAFGAVGLAATTWMRSWLDFDWVLVCTIPLFLFSATFFPLERYPRALQIIVQCSPLYHGADLLRHLILGGVGWAQLVSVAYLVAMLGVGLWVAQRRVARLLQP